MKHWLLITLRCLGIYSIALALGIFMITVSIGSPIYQFLSPINGFLVTVLLFGGALFVPFCIIAAIFAGIASFRPGVIPKIIGAVWLVFIVSAAYIIWGIKTDAAILEFGRFGLLLVGVATLVLTFLRELTQKSEANDLSIDATERPDEPKSV